MPSQTKHLLLVDRLERCCSSFRSFSQESLTGEERPCSVYLRREPLCSCHNPQDFSSPPTVSLISTSFSWVGWVRVEKSEKGEWVGRWGQRLGKSFESTLKCRNCHDLWPIVSLNDLFFCVASVELKVRKQENKSYLHFVLEGVGITVHTGVSFQFTQYNAFLKEKNLSLMPSRGRLNFWSLLPHCEDPLKGRQVRTIQDGDQMWLDVFLLSFTVKADNPLINLVILTEIYYLGSIVEQSY